MKWSARSRAGWPGLGVSSIGDSWYGFGQNVKVIEEYYDLLEKNELPVYRGHILNDEDLVIRRHILNLMCSFETSWECENMYFPEIPEVLIKLKEMEQDELLEIHAKSINILPKGQPFVRNICMAFDLLLQRKTPDVQLFSMTV